MWQFIASYLVSCLPATAIIGLIHEDTPTTSVEIWSMGFTWPIWAIRRIVIVSINKFKGE